MKNIKFVTLLVFTYTNLIFTQNAPAVLDIINSAPTQEPTTMTSTINLTGNFQELVIPVGFSDYNPSYPQITQNNNYPPLGVFPDGTLLNDFIQQNGPINVEEWYEEGMEHFFSSQSGGDYLVDFIFVKMPNGDVYTPTQSLSDFAGGGSINNVIWNNWEDICNEVTDKVYNDYPAIFNGIDCIHFVFDVGTTPGDAFHTDYGGTINENVTFANGNIDYYTTKPITIQKKLRDLPHERMHIIGSIAGKPSSFEGFPDRGSDKSISDNFVSFHNLQWGYDVMAHNGTLVAQHSLYGLPPMLSHDLIFLGWIDSDEILEINGTNQINIKLMNVNYNLTTEQKNNNFYRIIKVMINENYSGEKDEYFLVEYHAETEFDKNFTNYDQGNDYGTGVLIWHIKEKTNLINKFSDNLIDLEVAVPYNGWYGNPIPNDSYPRNYTRPTIWNNRAGDSDYLDDLQVEYYSPWDKDVFSYLQDGGRHIWETTDPRTTFNWYPPETEWFYRPMSMKSDFFTDESINGVVTNKFSDATRPSSKDWGGAKSHIKIKDIKRVNDYMTISVLNNCWEGTIDENSTMSGNVIIGDDLTIASGVSLTINDGTEVSFENNAKLVVNGTLIVNGISSNQVLFTSSATNPIPNDWQGIEVNGSNASATLNYCTVEYASKGINFTNGASGSVTNSTFQNNYYGIYTNYADPIIENCNITGNDYGLYLRYSYTTPSWTSVDISDCNITNNTTYGLYIYSSSPTLSSNNISNNVRGSVLYYSSQPIIEQTSFTNSTYYGLACYGSASPKFHYNSSYTYGGYNTITGNGAKGVRVTGSSNPNFGENSASLGGYNSIYGNTGYEIENTTSITVKAQNNWWGAASGPQPGDLYGSVAAFIYLDYDPNGGQQKNIITDLPVYVYDKNSDLPEDLQQASFKQSIAEFSASAEMYKQHFIKNTKSEFNSLAAVGYLNSLSYYLEPKAIVEEVEQTLSQELSTETIVELKSGLSVNFLSNKQTEFSSIRIRCSTNT